MSALDRAERVGRPLTRWSLTALWRLCLAEGVAIVRTAGAGISVRGPRSVVNRLAPVLALHRKALLWGGCRLCRHDLAQASGYCRFCEPILGRRVELVAGSEEERALLASVGHDHEQEHHATSQRGG